MIDFSKVTHLKYIIDFETVCGEDEDGNYDDSTLPAFFQALEPKLKEAFPNATFNVWADNSSYVTERMLEVTVADGRMTGDVSDEMSDLESAIEEEMFYRLIPAALTETE